MTPTVPSSRLISLDAFRGFTIAAMILVNNPGNWSTVYRPFLHAKWHGWTFTDTIFPFFLFIMGVAMAISFSRRHQEGVDRGVMMRTVAKRAAILFFLGFLLSAYPRFNLSTVRIMGVLERISLCYLATSAVLLYLPRARDQWLVMAGLFAFYFAVTFGIDVPGYGRGDLTPEGHAAGYLDRLILGEQHLWSGTKVFDPEGLVSTLPAIVSTYLGWIFGSILQSVTDHQERLKRWLIWATGLTVAGLLLTVVIPLNKSMWTPSYTLFMAGLGGLTLSLCYWLIEVKRLRRWAEPFVMMSMNSLAIFWLSGFMVRNLYLLKLGEGENQISAWGWFYQAGFASWLGPYPSSFAFALANVVFWLLIAWALYRKKIFIKL